MDFETIARQLGATCQARGLRIATAESCTGGWIAKAITDIAGSSAWFERGFITYSNPAKNEQLGVPAELIDAEGAVSEATVRAMAAGALARSATTLVVAVTGIAGPEGGSPQKPVGTVWFGFAINGVTEAYCRVFSGDREAVRRAAVQEALTGLQRMAEQYPGDN